MQIYFAFPFAFACAFPSNIITDSNMNPFGEMDFLYFIIIIIVIIHLRKAAVELKI